MSRSGRWNAARGKNIPTGLFQVSATSLGGAGDCGDAALLARTVTRGLGRTVLCDGNCVHWHCPTGPNRHASRSTYRELPSMYAQRLVGYCKVTYHCEPSHCVPSHCDPEFMPLCTNVIASTCCRFKIVFLMSLQSCINNCKTY